MLSLNSKINIKGQQGTVIERTATSAKVRLKNGKTVNIPLSAFKQTRLSSTFSSAEYDVDLSDLAYDVLSIIETVVDIAAQSSYSDPVSTPTYDYTPSYTEPSKSYSTNDNTDYSSASDTSGSWGD